MREQSAFGKSVWQRAKTHRNIGRRKNKQRLIRWDGQMSSNFGLLVSIACCGGLGAVLRYAISSWAASAWSTPFPVGTLIVNVAGCGLLGALMQATELTTTISPAWKTALAVGLLGGLTTFSTFGAQTLSCLAKGHFNLGILNIAANMALGLLAVWLGAAAVRGWLS